MTDWLLDHLLSILATVIAGLGGALAKQATAGPPLKEKLSTSWLGRRYNAEKRNTELRDQLAACKETIKETGESHGRQRENWARERDDWTRERENLERSASALLERNETLVRLVESLTVEAGKGSLTISAPLLDTQRARSESSSQSSTKQKPPAETL